MQREAETKAKVLERKCEKRLVVSSNHVHVHTYSLKLNHLPTFCILDNCKT